MKATVFSVKGKSEDLEVDCSAHPEAFRVLIPVNPRSLSTDLVTLRATSINSFSTSPRTFLRTSSSDSGGIYRKRNQRE